MRVAGLIALTCALNFAPGQACAQSFTEALTAAYKSNPRLLAERERVKETDEQWVQARALGRLSASANAEVSPSGVRTPNTGFFGAPAAGTNTEFITTRQAGVQLIQPIYQGGRVRYQKRQAKAAVFAAREGLRNIEQSILQQAATAYAEVVRAEEASAIRRNNVTVLLRQQEAAGLRFDVGEGTRTDIAQADSRLAQARIGLAQADAELTTARATFQRLVGFPPERLTEVPRFALPSSLDEAVRIAMSANPQLMSAYLNEAVADASVDVAKSQSRPQVSLNGQLGVIREGLSGLSQAETAQLTARVTIPLLAGGANKSRVRQAKAARNRAGFESRDLERALRQTVSQLYAQIEASNESVQNAQLQVAAAEVAFEGVELEQQVGTRTALDVLDAEQELLNARLNVVEAELRRNQSTFQLLAVLGAFDADSLQLPVNVYDPQDYFDAVEYDGYKAFADDYVPKAFVKIGGQVPDLLEGAVEGAADIADALEISDFGGKALEGTEEISLAPIKLLKEGVDTITLQNRDTASQVVQGHPAEVTEGDPGTTDGARSKPRVRRSRYGD